MRRDLKRRRYLRKIKPAGNSETSTPQMLAKDYLKRLKVDHPEWTLDEFIKHIYSPCIMPAKSQVQQAGFSDQNTANQSQALGYGTTPFGKSSYGGTRRISDGINAVCRKVTALGQFSYRGFQYSLGSSQRNTLILIVDEGRYLQISLPHRKSRKLLSRHYQK